MKKFDFVSGMFLFILAVLICFGSWRLYIGTPQEPGPGFLPFIAGLSMVGLSIAIWAKALTQGKEQKKFFDPQSDRKDVYMAFMMLFFYALFLERLGFLLVNVCFFLGINRFVTHQGWIRSIVYAALYSSSVYVLFKILFKAPVPAGILVF